MSRIFTAFAMIAGLAFVSNAALATEAAPLAPRSPASPESLVDAQLKAYNERNLEAFLAPYSEDVVLAKYPNTVTQTGKAKMRTRYQKSFANPNVRAQIVRRIVLGQTVIDHERITAPPAKGQLEAVAIYEVADGKIVRVTFIDDAPKNP